MSVSLVIPSNGKVTVVCLVENAKREREGGFILPQSSNFTTSLQSVYAAASAMIRRLYLGSVSSLSFEEEENEFCQATRRKSMGSIEDKRNGGAEAGLNMELHEMLTDRLYEQVGRLTSEILNKISVNKYE